MAIFGQVQKVPIDRGSALPCFDEKSLSGSVSAKGQWVLSRYDKKSLSNKQLTVTQIASNRGMIFGILEANNGSIWFRAYGAYRYDGNTINDFKYIKVKKWCCADNDGVLRIRQL